MIGTKYRAWSIENKAMMSVLSLEFDNMSDGTHGNVKQITCAGWGTFSPEQVILMKNTGLWTVPKPLVPMIEIFQGDVLGGSKKHGSVFVRWDDEHALFEAVWYAEDQESETLEIKETSALLANELDDCKDDWEVIGNINSNPELIDMIRREANWHTT